MNDCMLISQYQTGYLWSYAPYDLDLQRYLNDGSSSLRRISIRRISYRRNPTPTPLLTIPNPNHNPNRNPSPRRYGIRRTEIRRNERTPFGQNLGEKIRLCPNLPVYLKLKLKSIFDSAE